MMNLMIVIVTKKTAVKIRTDSSTDSSFDSEDVDSADDQHQNSYGGSQYKPYVSPVNQESTEKKRKIVVTPQNIKPNQIKQTGST